jgi:aspartate/methionine/tyrosine aminotransferase
VSKSLGLPQLKLAWITVGGPPELASTALDRLDYITDAYLSVSTPVALAAPQLITSCTTLRTAISERCRSNLAILRTAVRSVPAVSVPLVGGGWSAILRFPSVVDDEEIALRLLADHGIAVHPGYLFDLPYDGALVLSLLPPEPIWRRGVDGVLETIAAEIRGSD